MKKTLLLSAVLSLLLSCQQDSVSITDTDPDPILTDTYASGKAVIKVSDALAEQLESDDVREDFIAGANIRRTFTHGGKYEERMRKSGLHLWYTVEFDEDIPVTKAGADLIDIQGVELVEYVPVPVLNDKTSVFDDPEFSRQWHFSNPGNAITGLSSGCDINVQPVWNQGIVGSENVIVAVIDGGFDVNHEDLAANVWKSVDENGKIINGHNFVTGYSKINPEDHGTHVAGTIAAVNNNGIGVSGIAGGDAAKGIKGVRIMSCQIFEGDYLGDGADAMVWAANHGAVIAQNSWGYISGENGVNATPEYDKAAINYFNTYAGCDEDGNQLADSPMKGGVVIFASGNDALSVGYPASYEGCIAVSAVAGDYELAYYSNYGDWVDITAPGGDKNKNHMVVSTILNNGYGRMQGTSMACPHVSGVAALVVSEFGGPGFTREDLIDRLLKTASDISLPANHMGHGLVDAQAAVAHYGEYLPNVPEFAEYEELSGTALNIRYIIPEDNNGVRNRTLNLYWSESPFDKVSENLYKMTIKAGRTSPGDTVVFNVENLSENTTYYFSALGCDALGYESALSENFSVTTRDNLPPVIEALDGTEHVYKQYMWSKLRFKITDPESAIAEVRYEKATDAESFTLENDGLYYLVIDAKLAAAGSYTSRIVVTDDRGETAECKIAFVIEENVAPVVKKAVDNQVMSSNSSSLTIKLTDCFTDADGETLKFTATSSDNDVVKFSLAKDVLTLTSSAFGNAVITVKAEDAVGKYAECSFNVVVRDGSKEFDLYPNPVTDGKLYVRGSDASEADLKIVSSSGAVVYESKVIPDPFSPAVEDISALLPGVYNVKVTGKTGKVFTQNIVKL